LLDAFECRTLKASMIREDTVFAGMPFHPPRSVFNATPERHMPGNGRPAFEAFVVDGDGKDAFWTKIGAAWPHEDGKGFNVQLVALPANGRIALRVPKEREASSQESQEREPRPARPRKGE
jgi:hypothetical protein